MNSWRNCVSIRVMSYSDEGNELVTEVVNELRRYLGKDFYVAQVSRVYENRSGRGCRVYIVVCSSPRGGDRTNLVLERRKIHVRESLKR